MFIDNTNTDEIKQEVLSTTYSKKRKKRGKKKKMKETGSCALSNENTHYCFKK